MDHSTLNALLCRAIVLLLMLLIWYFFFLNARFAYTPGGTKKALRFLLVLGSAAVFCLQVLAMERFNPEDAYGSHFLLFVLSECGGALAVLFWRLIRERAKVRKN